MNRIFKFLDMASEFAMSKDDRRTYFLGAIAIRKDGVIVKSLNGPTETPERKAHAEYKVLRKCDVGAEVFVARKRRDGSVALAKPCKNCEKAMRTRGVKRVYYTIGPKEYGCLEL